MPGCKHAHKPHGRTSTLVFSVSHRLLEQRGKRKESRRQREPPHLLPSFCATVQHHVAAACPSCLPCSLSRGPSLLIDVGKQQPRAQFPFAALCLQPAAHRFNRLHLDRPSPAPSKPTRRPPSGQSFLSCPVLCPTGTWYHAGVVVPPPLTIEPPIMSQPVDLHAVLQNGYFSTSGSKIPHRYAVYQLLDSSGLFGSGPLGPWL